MRDIHPDNRQAPAALMLFGQEPQLSKGPRPLPRSARVSTWRRRHLHGRAIVALIALASLVGPGVGALVLVWL
jgi:hypothetical protein